MSNQGWDSAPQAPQGGYPQQPQPTPAAGSSKKWLIIGGVAVLVIALVVGAFLLGSNGKQTTSAGQTAAASATPTEVKSTGVAVTAKATASATKSTPEAAASKEADDAESTPAAGATTATGVIDIRKATEAVKKLPAKVGSFELQDLGNGTFSYRRPGDLVGVMGTFVPSEPWQVADPTAALDDVEKIGNDATCGTLGGVTANCVITADKFGALMFLFGDGVTISLADSKELVKGLVNS